MAVKRTRMLAGAIIALGLALVLWLATRPPPLTIQGEVSSDRVDISPRAAGRVVALAADVGDNVEKGAVIATLESPQLEASLLAARAALAVAQADLARISSTRPETIAARRAELSAADADVRLYAEAYDRQSKLIKSGFSPQARLDEATRNLEAATRKRETANSALKLAAEGASPEEKALVAAQVKQAEALLHQREVDVAELTVHAPISGQITTRVAGVGENFSAGSPIFSLIDLSDVWFTFNLREDLLHGLKVGDRFTVTIPAFKGREVPVQVSLINVQGQYATWRATRATGDFDLRTFEVRAKPVEPVQGLRPGMSAIAAWTARDR